MVNREIKRKRRREKERERERNKEKYRKRNRKRRRETDRETDSERNGRCWRKQRKIKIGVEDNQEKTHWKFGECRFRQLALGMASAYTLSCSWTAV